MLNLKKILFGGVAALFVVGASAIAQTWFNFPEVGGPAFCSSTVNSTCVNTVPAGPSIPGTATVPIDTNLPGGRSPQTAKASVATVGLGGIQNQLVVNGTSFFLNQGVGRVFLNASGAIGSVAINLPAATFLYDGQVLIVASNQVITSLVLNPGLGTTINEATTAGGPGVPVMYIYSSGSQIWYRIGNGV